jgi:hypothetical protein
MSLTKKIALLARNRVEFDRAETLLAPSLAQKPPEKSGAERMREEKQEFASLHGLQASRDIAREERLKSWMGMDICPPPNDD